MSILTRVKRFSKGFVYAFNGIAYCVRTQRNMRVHLCAAFYVIWAMLVCGLSRGEKAAVIITVGLVISLEMLNTAVEACVDMISPEYSKLAGIAKDAAAGAVLCSAIAAVGVAAAVFIDKDRLSRLYGYFASSPWAVAGLLVSAVAWAVFIFSENSDK